MVIAQQETLNKVVRDVEILRKCGSEIREPFEKADREDCQSENQIDTGTRTPVQPVSRKGKGFLGRRN